jgi:hypothetical protein
VLRSITASYRDDLCEAFLKSLEHSEAGSTSRCIIGDNGLTADFRARWPLPVYVQVPHDPFIHAVAINACIAASAPGDDLIVLGDDTEMITPCWLTECERLLSAWPSDFGLLNLSEPTTEQTYGTSSPLIHAHTTLAWMATLVPRRVWDQIGEWDERFAGYGFDDTDYCLRLLHAGYKLGVTNVARVLHKGTVSYQEIFGGWGGVQQRAFLNYRLFYDKWTLPEPSTPRIEFFQCAEHFNRDSCRCVR